MNPKIKIAILDMNAGRENEGLRCIKQLAGRFLSQENIEGHYDIFDIRIKNEFPDLYDYDIFLSSGGPGDPQPQGDEWEQIYNEFLDKIYNHNKENHDKKYLFLICHSFQLACIHWELGNVCKRKSTSFGVMPIHKTIYGTTEELFKGLHEPFWAVDSRDYQLIQPNRENLNIMGAKILAKEKIRPHIALERAIMAIRFTDEIIGTQFHPEADAEGMLHYFSNENKKDLIIHNHGEEKYNGMVKHLQDEDSIKLTEKTIIPLFFAHAYENILKNQTILS